MTIPKPFLMGRTEVTRAEFEVYAREKNFEPVGLCRVWNKTKGRYDDDRNRTWRKPGVPEQPQPNHPISCVNWFESKDYIAWLAAKPANRTACLRKPNGNTPRAPDHQAFIRGARTRTAAKPPTSTTSPL